ncbi:MAG TPA: molybdopterin synthase catalytic subunit MoaE [Methylophilaceae bacterium]|nr:molybdopterin synthase catalytic subunit MoaE [Methylophilaceae bacterium]HAJ71270.1 molybdopterin synthase catalytic subunit MoaE [Methylophilaceae bacterium]
MKILVQSEDFDVSDELNLLRQSSPNIGAVVSFVGLVRELNEDAIQTLTLEHYPGMTEKSLHEIAQQALTRWDVLDVTIIHRVGTLRLQDQIVLVAVTSAHRHNAFLACEFIMDYLKTQAPFWKKEHTQHGEHWVEAKSIDDKASQRWELKN